VLVNSGNAVYHPRHYHLLAVGLARAGLQAVVVGQAGARSTAAHDAVRIRTIRGLPGRVGRIVSAPLALWHANRENPSLVQINSLDLLPWAVLARRVFRVPVIYDSNEDYASYMLIKEWLPRQLRAPVSRIVGRAEPWLASKLDATLVADPDTGRQFEDGGKPVVLVHNFAWRSFGEVGEAEPEFTYDVLYNGSLPRYTRENLLGTARALEARGLEVRWCLALRNFNDKQRNELEDALTEHRLTSRFSLHYNLPFDEMPRLVARSRVGFIPLPDEQKFRHNIPRKLFEFLAVGRPVVASDLAPIRRFVAETGCCLLVRPGDAEGYAAAIAQLLEDDPAAREAGARGRKLIANGMTADEEIVGYVNLCRALSRRRSDAI
jgi:glycosyltransferase involved in cell wall biosynthesis